MARAQTTGTRRVTPPTPEVLTVKEAAALLRCSESTMRRLDIPYRLAGGRRYSRDAILAWLSGGHSSVVLAPPGVVNSEQKWPDVERKCRQNRKTRTRHARRDADSKSA